MDDKDKDFRNNDDIKVTRGGGYRIEWGDIFKHENARRQFHLIEKYRKQGKLK